MWKSLLQYSVSITMLIAVLFPLGIVYAQPPAAPAPQPSVILGGKVTFDNPIKAVKADTLSEFLIQVVNVVVFIASPLIVIFIIYAGFLFVTAGDDEGQRTTARKTLLWALVGAGVIITAVILARIIQDTVLSLS